MSFYIIEKEEQLQYLPHFDKCFVHVITNNNNYHPAISYVSLVYVKPFNNKGYIFCINHTESLSLKWQSFKKYLSEKELYAVDAKFTRYFFSTNINDITFNYISQGGTKFDFDKCEPNIIYDFYNQYGTLKNVNKIIPISKHYEYCENIYEIIKPYLLQNTEYEKKLTNVFFKIEKEGIKLDKECFIKHHENHNTPHFSIKGGRAYTHYNLYTLTGRPSNTFNGINYAALNKDNGERACYIPNNNVFIEADFQGYHPRLLGELINFPFSSDKTTYETLSEVLNVTPQEAKELTFKQTYGGVWDEYSDKPFFGQVKSLTDDLWNTIQHKGHIDTPSGKSFRLKNIDNPTPAKLLNYYIQNQETYKNVLQLNDIFNDFRPLKSRIVLYTYDAILIDASNDELNKIKEIINKLKYPVKLKYGVNYNELKQ